MLIDMGYLAIGISLPQKILLRIDSERGDVSRSRYLLRAIENALRGKGKEEQKKNSNEDPLDVDLEACNQASPEVHKSSDLS